jgi:hypothetical protein
VKCNEISPFTIPCPLRKKETLECPFYRSNNLEILIRRRVQIQILLAWWNIIILYYAWKIWDGQSLHNVHMRGRPTGGEHACRCHSTTIMMWSLFFCGLPQIFRRDERLGAVHTNDLKGGCFHLWGTFRVCQNWKRW